jgi:hypothetical protein
LNIITQYPNEIIIRLLFLFNDVDVGLVVSNAFIVVGLGVSDDI